MLLNIHGTGINLTDAIKQEIENKIGSLTKFFVHITKAEVEVGVTTHHHHKGDIFYAEVNVHVPGKILRVRKEEPDLYKAINKVKDHLKVDLEKMKEKLRVKDRGRLRESKGYNIV